MKRNTAEEEKDDEGEPRFRLLHGRVIGMIGWHLGKFLAEINQIRNERREKIDDLHFIGEFLQLGQRG